MPVIRAETVGPVTLVLADCLFGQHVGEFVEPGSAAAIIMDPPYCSGGFTEASRRTSKSMGVKSEALGWFEGDNMTTLGLQFLLRACAIDSWTMLRKGGTLSMFMDWRMIPALAPAIESARLRWQQLVIWDKGSAGLGNGFRAQHETLLHFSKGVPIYNGARNGNVLRCNRPRSETREHPTEKPVELLAKIIDTVAEPGALIVDWFGGAGSTGVAAIAGGRRAVCFEVDPVFHDRAVERCRAELAKGRMFAAPAKAEQGGLEVGTGPEPAENYDLRNLASSEPARPRDALDEVADHYRAMDAARLSGRFTTDPPAYPGAALDEAAAACGLTADGLGRAAMPREGDLAPPESFDDLGDAYESRGPDLTPPGPAYDEAAGAAEFDRLMRAGIDAECVGEDLGAALDNYRAMDAAAHPAEVVAEAERLVVALADAYVAPVDAIKTEGECMRCRGEGWIWGDAGPGTMPIDCPRCLGTGDAGERDQCPAGHTNLPCPACDNGLPGTVCALCLGYGMVNFYAIPEAKGSRECTRTGQPLRCFSRLCAAAGRCTRAAESAQAKGALL